MPSAQGYQKRALDSLGTGLMEGTEPPRGCWELNQGPLETQPMSALHPSRHVCRYFIGALKQEGSPKSVDKTMVKFHTSDEEQVTISKNSKYSKHSKYTETKVATVRLSETK